MRMRSTGLGKTELIGDFTQLEPRNDHLVLHVYTTFPVHWHVRTALTRQDIFTLFKVILRGLVNGAIIKVLLGRTKNLPPLEPY